MSNFDKLQCSDIVYRALRSKRWIDSATGLVSPSAFVRRLEKDKVGLSVNPAATCSLSYVQTKVLNNCHGVVSLHTGRIRDIALDVIQDSRTHAHITGVPYANENLAEAERLAVLLAEQSRVQWLPD